VSAGRGWVEESLWVLGHLVNVEEHAVELGLLDVAGEVREERRGFQDEWWRALGLREEFYRKAWCLFKHLAALMVHAEELAAWGEAPPELREASRGAAETAKRLFWALVELGRQRVEETVEVKA
jgi:hypothetical protein